MCTHVIAGGICCMDWDFKSSSLSIWSCIHMHMRRFLLQQEKLFGWSSCQATHGERPWPSLLPALYTEIIRGAFTNRVTENRLMTSSPLTAVTITSRRLALTVIQHHPEADPLQLLIPQFISVSGFCLAGWMSACLYSALRSTTYLCQRWRAWGNPAEEVKEGSGLQKKQGEEKGGIYWGV